jgi:hypothetical protein
MDFFPTLVMEEEEEEEEDKTWKNQTYRLAA